MIQILLFFLFPKNKIHPRNFWKHVAGRVGSCDHENMTPNSIRWSVSNLRQSQDCKISQETEADLSSVSSEYLQYLEMTFFNFPQKVIIKLCKQYHYVEENRAITMISLPTLSDFIQQLHEIYKIFRPIFPKKFTPLFFARKIAETIPRVLGRSIRPAINWI